MTMDKAQAPIQTIETQRIEAANSMEIAITATSKAIKSPNVVASNEMSLMAQMLLLQTLLLQTPTIPILQTTLTKRRK